MAHSTGPIIKAFLSGGLTRFALSSISCAITCLGFSQGPIGGGTIGGQFTLNIVNTGSGISRNVTPSGTTETTIPFSSCNASVSQVVATTTAKCTGKSHITVSWIPSYPGEQAPPYAYILLTSYGAFSSRLGVTGSISLGLPEVGPISEGNYRELIQFGRKVLKLKIENGSAEYDVEGGVDITVMAPAGIPLSDSNSGSGRWQANASLDLKAIGLIKDSTSRFTTEVVGTHDRWIIEPYVSDDFERQKSSVGTTAQIESVWNPTKHRYVKTITSGLFSSTLNLVGVGSWVNSPIQNATITSEQCAVSVDPFTSTAWIHSPYSPSELMEMRTSPKALNVKATTSDPGSLIQGPFKATRDFEIWAPARLLEVIGRTTETSDRMPVTMNDANGEPITISARLTYVGQTGNLTLQFENFNSHSTAVTHSFSLSIAGTIKDFWEVGVGYDYGIEVGEESGFNLVGGASLGIGPCVDPTEIWTLMYRTKKTTEARWMGVQDPNTGAVNQGREETQNVVPVDIQIEVMLVESGA